MTKLEHRLTLSRESARISKLYWLESEVFSTIICLFSAHEIFGYDVDWDMHDKFAALLFSFCRTYSYVPLCVVGQSWGAWQNVAPKCMLHNFIHWPATVVFGWSQSVRLRYLQSGRSYRSVLDVVLSLSEFFSDFTQYTKLCYPFCPYCSELSDRCGSYCWLEALVLSEVFVVFVTILSLTSSSLTIYWGLTSYFGLWQSL